jgi:hypothetical protein
MNKQVDLDAIKVSAELWHMKFKKKFYEAWNEGLEEQQAQQPMQQELIGGAEEIQNPLPPMGGLGNA